MKMKAKKNFKLARVKRCRERTLYLLRGRLHNRITDWVIGSIEASTKYASALDILLKDVEVQDIDNEYVWNIMGKVDNV